MIHKGYTVRIELDEEREIFHGRVLGISDVVTFEGKTPDELKEAFRESVDDYLEFCAERKEPPQKPSVVSGQWSVVRTAGCNRQLTTDH